MPYEDVALLKGVISSLGYAPTDLPDPALHFRRCTPSGVL